MNATNLASRRNDILKAIINAHIDSAHPVSSFLLSRHFQFNLSPATIRNSMVELEREGYIKQPHTSAGRIPTDKGYRYYVDSLMEVGELSLVEEEELEHESILYQTNETEELFIEISRVLSQLTNCTALVHFPRKNSRRRHLYLEGAHFILEQPEFQDRDKVKLLFRAFDEKDELLSILEEDLYREGVSIHIGRENGYEDLEDCSLIISSCGLNNEVRSAFGVIGPKRMNYPKLVPLVNYVAGLVTKVMNLIRK